MAIGYGLTGKIRGKLGAQVYRIEAGKQIISEYNPEKQDRKSDKQIKQRSKVAIVNQLSKQFDWEQLTGLSTNRSEARRMFVGNMIANTSAVMDGPEKAVATVDLTALKLSKGAEVNVDSKSINRIGIGQTLANSSITFDSGSGVARYILTVLPTYIVPNPNVGAFMDSKSSLSQEVVAGQSCAATVIINQSTVATNTRLYCYAVPIVPNTLKKRVTYSAVLEAPQSGVISAEAWITLARADLFGATIYLGALDFE